MNRINIQNTIKLLQNDVEDKNINNIFINIQNNTVTTEEIKFLAKYGAYHNKLSFVKLACILNVDLHDNDDYLFRIAIDNMNSKLLFLLFKINYEFYETNFFNKTHRNRKICEIVLDIIFNNTNKKIVMQIMLYAFDNNIEISDRFIEIILNSNSPESLYFIFKDNLCNFLLQNETYNKKILYDICDSAYLFEMVCECATIKQLHIILKYHLLSDFSCDNIDDFVNVPEIITPEFIHEIILSKPKFYKMSSLFDGLYQITLDNDKFFDYFSKLIDTTVMNNETVYIIMLLTSSDIVTPEKLYYTFGEKYIKSCMAYYEKDMPRH